MRQNRRYEKMLMMTAIITLVGSIIGLIANIISILQVMLK